MPQKPKRVKSIEELKVLGQHDLFITLNGGAKTSKDVYYDGETFQILNNIDGTMQYLTEKQVLNDHIIGSALKKNALYRY